MSDLGLESLLAALRAAGMRVGVTELLRLHEVFARSPDLSGTEQLGSVLRALLVKSLDERAAFDREFDAWIGRAGREWPPHSTVSVPRFSAADRRSHVRHRRRRRLWPAAALVLLGLSISLGPDTGWSPKPDPRSAPEPPAPEPLPPDQSGSERPAMERSAPKPSAPEAQTLEPLTPEEVPADVRPVKTTEEIRRQLFTGWVPHLTVIKAEPVWQGWPAL